MPLSAISAGRGVFAFFANKIDIYPDFIGESVAHPAGLEPATAGLEIRCSIQLSYGCVRWFLTDCAQGHKMGPPRGKHTASPNRAKPFDGPSVMKDI